MLIAETFPTKMWGLFEPLTERKGGGGMTSIENLKAFSSGGGCYHAMCKWCGAYYVVSNDGFDCLSWYADEEMNTMIDSQNEVELYGNAVFIYQILLNYLKLQYPSIPFSMII